MIAQKNTLCAAMPTLVRTAANNRAAPKKTAHASPILVSMALMPASS
jgi:hypothetical protein